MAICPLCKSEYHQADTSQMTDEEKYIDFWSPTVGVEQAKKDWQLKQSMPTQRANYVSSDITGYISQVDGSWIDSKSKHRDHLKRHGMVEVGNDVPMKQRDVSVGNAEQRKRAIAEQVYGRLKY